MRRRSGGAMRMVLLALALTSGGSAANAITWGQEDTNSDYPNVGSIMALWNDGTTYLQWCSGTLIHPRAFLTAGHCVYSMQAYAAAGLVLGFWVTFDFDASIAAEYIPVADAILHPDYLTPPPSLRHWPDVGVLILADAVTGITPATLPYEGLLKELKRAHLLTSKTKILTVGYGTLLDFPPPEVVSPDDLHRRYAYSEFRGLLKSWLLVNQNPSAGNGGTGYGDSGGPAFWVDPQDQSLILVGTTSYGDPNLIATTFFQRTDIARTLGFINAVIGAIP